ILGTEPPLLEHRAAAGVEHALVYVGLDGEELGAVIAAPGLPEVGDLSRVQVAAAVAVDVHADLDLADELHQVDRRLPRRVAGENEAADRLGERAPADVAGDHAVAGRVDAAPPRRDRGPPRGAPLHGPRPPPALPRCRPR